MSTTPHQLFLLADHVKLSLLERQRAMTLNLQGTQQDGPITRSLETLRQGIESLASQAEELETTGGDATDLHDQLSRLRSQYTDLNSQFTSSSTTPTPQTATPNDPSLTSDFTAAKSRPSKSVRFNAPYRDASPDAQETANRNALFPSSYTDDDPPAPDQSQLSNQQIHAYHTSVLRDQDAQLDTLGESIGRQRMLGIQMGDEMDDQNAMLNDVERGVDRFQGNLDRARGRLGKVARKAKDNWSWVTIGVLILILVLLLAVLN